MKANLYCCIDGFQGCSIAVNGVCLTVTSYTGTSGILENNSSAQGVRRMSTWLIDNDDMIETWPGASGSGPLSHLTAAVVLVTPFAKNGSWMSLCCACADERFTVGCSPETLRRTNLVDLTAGEMVNMER